MFQHCSYNVAELGGFFKSPFFWFDIILEVEWEWRNKVDAQAYTKPCKQLGCGKLCKVTILINKRGMAKSGTQAVTCQTQLTE